MTINILWLSHLLPYPPIGGVRQRSFNLLKEVASAYSVDLVALSQKAHQKNEAERQQAINGLLTYCNRVFCHRIPSDKYTLGKKILLIKSLLTGRCFNTEWVKSSQFFDTIIQLCKLKSYDTVYLDTISLAPYLKKIPPIPNLLNHHNIESQLLFHRVSQESNIISKFFCLQEAIKLKFMEKKYCKKFNVNLCVSELDKSRLKNVLKNNIRIEIVKNGVDLTRLYPRKSPNNHESPSLLFVGGMTRLPNRDAVEYFAKEIWPKLKNIDNNIKLKIVGREPSKLLRKMATKDNNLFLPGFVDDVKPYYDEATLYICPIRDGGGTRLKVLDAMSAGLVVVSTPLGAEGIDAEDGKEILIAKSTDDFVYKIEMLLKDSNLRKTIGINARNFIEAKYDFKVIGAHLCEIIESIIH